MIYIYGLIDPLVHQIAYVGKTNDLYERWESHVKTEAPHVAGQWIQGLRTVGVEPTLVVLEVLPDDGDWENAERWWIAHGLRIGWPLTNTIHTREKGEFNSITLIGIIKSSHHMTPQTTKEPQENGNHAVIDYCQEVDFSQFAIIPKHQKAKEKGKQDEFIVARLISDYIDKYGKTPSQRGIQSAYNTKFGKMLSWDVIKKKLDNAKKEKNQ